MIYEVQVETYNGYITNPDIADYALKSGNFNGDITLKKLKIWFSNIKPNMSFSNLVFDKYNNDDLNLRSLESKYYRDDEREIDLSIFKMDKFSAWMRRYNLFTKYRLKDHLPIPTDCNMDGRRMAKWVLGSEDRKHCRHSTISSCAKSRYFHSIGYNLIGYNRFPTEQIKQIFPQYDVFKRRKRLINVVSHMRIIAESCYNLDEVDEGLRICNEILKIGKDNSMTNRVMKFTYNVLSRIYITKKDYEQAEKYVSLCVSIEPNSDSTQRVKKYLQIATNKAESLKEGEYYCADPRESKRGFCPLVKIKISGGTLLDDDTLERMDYLKTNFTRQCVENSPVFVKTLKLGFDSFEAISLFLYLQ